MNENQTIRAALDRHWAASDANDFEVEHDIYQDDAVLEYPQNKKRCRSLGQYDGAPSYTVSIMEFSDGKVAREMQYFGDPFEPGPSRAQ